MQSSGGSREWKVLIMSWTNMKTSGFHWRESYFPVLDSTYLSKKTCHFFIGRFLCRIYFTRCSYAA